MPQPRSSATMALLALSLVCLRLRRPGHGLHSLQRASPLSHHKDVSTLSSRWDDGHLSRIWSRPLLHPFLFCLRLLAHQPELLNDASRPALGNCIPDLCLVPLGPGDPQLQPIHSIGPDVITRLLGPHRIRLRKVFPTSQKVRIDSRSVERTAGNYSVHASSFYPPHTHQLEDAGRDAAGRHEVSNNPAKNDPAKLENLNRVPDPLRAFCAKVGYDEPVHVGLLTKPQKQTAAA